MNEIFYLHYDPNAFAGSLLRTTQRQNRLIRKLSALVIISGAVIISQRKANKELKKQLADIKKEMDETGTE